MTLPTQPNAPSQAHLQGTQSRNTKANLAKKPALCQLTAHRTPADEYQLFLLQLHKTHFIPNFEL
ncbi:MAG: hypothetical protein QM541_03175 [Flavobacterium sp.]|nr:hypothetical protein [Flavobacterium sp.]